MHFPFWLETSEPERLAERLGAALLAPSQARSILKNAMAEPISAEEHALYPETAFCFERVSPAPETKSRRNT